MCGQRPRACLIDRIELAVLLLCALAATATTTPSSSSSSSSSDLLLPVACYAQTGSDLLSDGGANVCLQGLCHARWQVQVDWLMMRVLAFSFRLEESGRCLDSYGAPYRVRAQCQVIAFSSEDASQNALSLQVSAIYYGGTTVVLSWLYRGAAVNCGTLATDPMALDALLITRQVSVTLAPVNALLTLVEAAPTPLSALALDCPLRPLECECRVGCAYPLAFWLANPKSVVWQRPAIVDHAPHMCGIALVDWVGERSSTRRYPQAVRDALKAWSVAKLNLANYDCASPMLQDADAYEAFHYIDERFTRETSAMEDLCYDRPPDVMLPTYAHVLDLWNAGALYDGVNDTLSPCACVQFECATQFGLNADNLEPTDVGGNRPRQGNVGANGVSLNSGGFTGLDRPQRWDTLKLTFFIVACALTVVLASCVFCMLAYCTYQVCRGVGPTGFGAPMNRYMFSRIGANMDETTGATPLASSLTHTDKSIVIGGEDDSY